MGTTLWLGRDRFRTHAVLDVDKISDELTPAKTKIMEKISTWENIQPRRLACVADADYEQVLETLSTVGNDEGSSIEARHDCSFMRSTT